MDKSKIIVALREVREYIENDEASLDCRKALWGLEKAIEVLMGDESGDKPTSDDNEPRICKVLGVHVGERFELGHTGLVLLVGEDGKIHLSQGTGTQENTTLSMNQLVNMNHLVNAINEPEYLTKCPRWTAKDQEDARLVMKTFGKNGVVQRRSPMVKGANGQWLNLTFNNLYINPDLFPSLGLNERAELSDILGEGEK